MIAHPKTDYRIATSTAPAEMPTAAEMLIQALVHEGVDTIFGYPGGAVLHIYDELWRARDRSSRCRACHVWSRSDKRGDGDRKRLFGLDTNRRNNGPGA